MTRIVVIGGTGYAGAAIITEAADRGHEVVSVSRTSSAEPHPGVRHVAADVNDEAALQELIGGAEVVVGALAPRGQMAGHFRETYRTIARLADAAGAALYVVGGFSSLRPAPGAPRFVSDLRHAPEEVHDELIAVSALVTTDLPAAPASLDWVFISPAGAFGAHAPGERRGITALAMTSPCRLRTAARSQPRTTPSGSSISWSSGRTTARTSTWPTDRGPRRPSVGAIASARLPMFGWCRPR